MASWHYVKTFSLFLDFYWPDFNDEVAASYISSPNEIFGADRIAVAIWNSDKKDQEN
jgi:hypothetical protein